MSLLQNGTQNEYLFDCFAFFWQNRIQFGLHCRKPEENATNWKKSHMQTFIIVWLILGLLASILVVAALMLSSRLSQEEGLTESYEDWEEKEAEVVHEMYPRQAEQ